VCDLSRSWKRQDLTVDTPAGRSRSKERPQGRSRSLEARDARGRIHRLTGQWMFVSDGKRRRDSGVSPTLRAPALFRNLQRLGAEVTVQCATIGDEWGC